MGSFYTTCGVENPLRRGVIDQVPRVLVDTGAELSWFPAGGPIPAAASRAA